MFHGKGSSWNVHVDKELKHCSMPASFFKKERKTTCSRCNAPIEEERVGQSHCKKCRAEYMREWRNKRQDLFNKAMVYYKQYSNQ